jgi:hypothetical protein
MGGLCNYGYDLWNDKVLSLSLPRLFPFTINKMPHLYKQGLCNITMRCFTYQCHTYLHQYQLLCNTLNFGV